MSSADTPSFHNRFNGTPSGPKGSNGHADLARDGAPSAAGFASARPIRKAGASQGDLTMNDLVARLRTALLIVRRRWIAALLAAALVGAAVGYYVLGEEPEHRAVTTMLAQSPLDEILESREIPRDQKGAQENSLQNHLSVMKSRRFSVSLASQFTPEEQAAIMAPYLEGEDPATAVSFEQFLASKMDVERERNRDFFILSFRHRDQDTAVLVANRMSAAYLKIVQDEIQQASATAAGIFGEQAALLKAEITRLEDEQRDFRKENNIISLEDNQGILAERLRQIDHQLATYRFERVKLQTQLEKAKADLAVNPIPFDNTLLANFGNNQQLRQELDRLNGQRQVLSSRYGSRHVKMREIDANIRGIRDTIASNFELALRDLESQFANARLIESGLEQEFAAAFESVIEIGRRANRLQILESEIVAKRNALTDLLKRANTASLVSNIPSDVMRVIDPAYISYPTISRKVMAIGLIGLFGGIAFVVAPLVLHLFDQRITSAMDVEREFGSELLGGVPRLSGMTAAERPHIVRDHVNPAKMEPFMAITAQLELLSTQPACRTFVVTSAVPGEGKSVVVSNLASAFSQLGRRTLIIDSDLRRPMQHLMHRTEEDRGLMAWARAGFPMHDLFGPQSPLGVQRLVGGTHLIGAGGEDPQPMQYLISSHMTALLEELKKHYDAILIDTPPAGLFQDALVLTRTSGESIVVAREAFAPIAQIRRTLSDLRKTAAPPIGMILNDFSSNNMNPRLAYSSSYHGYSRYEAKAPRTGQRKRPHPTALT